MNGKRFGIGLVLAAAATAVILSAAFAARSEGPTWQRALAARSEALNRDYRLGSYTERDLGSPGAGWLKALAARSEALNRSHGIGGQARRTTGAEAAWLHALAVRSDALNREYRLGQYASQP